LVAASNLPGSGALRRYVAVSIAAAICLFAAQALFTQAIAPFVGVFQRILAFTLVVPIGVSAWVLAARFRSAMLSSPRVGGHTGQVASLLPPSC
jgi:hypothetical protein